MKNKPDIVVKKKLNDFDQSIIDDARKGPMAFAVQNDNDQRNFLEFVKFFALTAIHDSEIQEELLKTKF